jgi:hypothetical protein
VFASSGELNVSFKWVTTPFLATSDVWKKILICRFCKFVILLFLLTNLTNKKILIYCKVGDFFVLILTVFIIILISVLCPLRDHSNPRDSRKVLRSVIENRWLFRPTSILRYMGTTEKICPRVNHTTNVLSKSIVSVFLFILLTLLTSQLFFLYHWSVKNCFSKVVFGCCCVSGQWPLTQFQGIKTQK